MQAPAGPISVIAPTEDDPTVFILFGDGCDVLPLTISWDQSQDLLTGLSRVIEGEL